MTDDSSLIKLLPWDSSFFGFSVASVQKHTLSVQEAEEVLTFCKEHQVRCAYFLGDSTAGKGLGAAQEIGFRLVDVRASFVMPLKSAMPLADCCIEQASLEDIPVLRTIAVRMHHDSRFYMDENFPRERCDALYAQWIENCVRDPKQECLLVRLEDRIVGYLSTRSEPGVKNDMILMGLELDVRRRGFASALVHTAMNSAFAQGCTEVHVSTQGSNPGAMALYQRLGFRLTSLQPWFHAWFSQEDR